MKTGKILVLGAALLLNTSAWAESLHKSVEDSREILAARQGSMNPIPAAALSAAKGVAIVDITKGGFIIGGTGGDGVVLLKNKKGVSGAMGISSWSAPIPILFSGGSFGAQVGGSTTKAIILLNSDQAVRTFTSAGKLAWDAQATGTAGGNTDAERVGGLLSDQDVVIYKETEGLYGGATVGGSNLAINDEAIEKAYGSGVYVRDIVEGKVKAPDYAESLINLLEGKR